MEDYALAYGKIVLLADTTRHRDLTSSRRNRVVSIWQIGRQHCLDGTEAVIPVVEGVVSVGHVQLLARQALS